MSKKERQKKHKAVSSKLHPRNKHNGRYDFVALVKSDEALKPFVRPNKYGDESIDFFDPHAVKALNGALLKHHYKIENWDIPEGYLCPPIPGRADYIHYVADLLKDNNNGIIPRNKQVHCLDVGVGANYIYPIIGIREYGWSFVSTDIDKTAISSVEVIVKNNPLLEKYSELRFQSDPTKVFAGIIQKEEMYDVTICNPPFHASQEDANAATLRKLKNLSKSKEVDLIKNFGGQSNELWCVGGEGRFIKDMINESRPYANQCLWFTTLASKKETVESADKWLRAASITDAKVIPISHGNKSTRIIAWTYLSAKQRKIWAQARW